MFKRKIFSFLISVMLVFSFPVSVLADELYTPDGFAKQIDTYKDLALSASNAIRNKSWDDNISVASSLGSVSNTVDFSGCRVKVRYNNGSEFVYGHDIPLSLAGTFSYVVPAGEKVNNVVFFLHPSASLPVSGKYKVTFDFASDASMEYSNIYNYMEWRSKNQKSQITTYKITDFRQSSGDLYGSFILSLQSNISVFSFDCTLKDTLSGGAAIGGKLSVNFSQTSGSANINSPGTAPSSDDIQSGIASTTTQIASSVNEVYESIQQLMQHISNQLAALWDQMYNYMHVPMYNKAQEILNAIKAIQLKVNIDVSSIVDSINDMSTNVVDKVTDQISNDNKNADDIQNGYDSSGMDSDSSKLDNSLKDYEDAEGTVLDSVNDALNNFSFDASLSDYKSIVSTVSEFLQALYDSSGGFRIVINLSLLLSIASLVIGFYRFKEGG